MKQVREGYKMTELGQIPVEWEICSLSKVADRLITKNKGSISENVLTISAQYGLVNQTDFFNKKVASQNIEGYYLLSKNDFAYNKSYSKGYPMGAIKSLQLYDHGVVSTLYICFRLRETVSIDFFIHYFDSDLWHSEVQQIAQEGARNHGLLNVSVNEFFDVNVIVPSIQEQQKIAEILSTVDDQIENTKLLIEKTKELKKGLMQQLLTKGIGHTEFKQTELGEIPVEWEVRSLGDISNRVAVGYVGSINCHYTDETGVLLLRTGNINGSKIDLSDLKYVTNDFHLKNKKSQLTSGDIIISRHGDSGSAAVIPNNIGVANCLNVVVVKKSEEMNSEFIAYLFNSGFIKSILSRTKAGSVQGVINTKEINAALVPYPSLVEQNNIVIVLKKVDEQIESYEQEKEKYLELKKGLMQELLTGQMRVTV